MMEATSPTDRIEQLLNKYKARYNLSSVITDSSNASSPRSTPLFTPTKSDKGSWDDINKQLRSHGFTEISITTASEQENGGVSLDSTSLLSLKSTVTGLLEDVERKQNLVQQLLGNANKESDHLKLMRKETDQSRHQVDNLQKQLILQATKYKELEEVHFVSLKDHSQQMESIKKDHTGIVATCQELQTKCLEQETEISQLKNQLATLRLSTDLQLSDTASSQQSSPVKKTIVLPPYPDQQLETDFNMLQTQLNNLKYKNTKLQLDLQNRPERQELRQTQKRVKQLEQELMQCKTLLSSEQQEAHHVQKHLESICAVLGLGHVDQVTPCLQQYQLMLKAMKDMEKCLAGVVDLMAHPNSPALQHSPTPHHGHMTWCHYSWDHVIPTLKQWLKELNGLKELYAVFADVCDSLKLHRPKHHISDTCEYSTLSAKQMAGLLRKWLLKDPNRKVAQQQALVTMVTHYQQMFGVKWVGGVYASMSRVAMTLEETQNVLKTIKGILHLDDSASGRQLVVMVERLASNHDNTGLMAQIVEQIGITDPNQVVERLKLCQRFFPAFQQVISEVQEFLGVHTLGAISPALHDLHRRTVK